MLFSRRGINLAIVVPQYAPSAAYRQVEFMLGRIPSLTYVSDFTTQTGDFGNVPGNATSGNATYMF